MSTDAGQKRVVKLREHPRSAEFAAWFARRAGSATRLSGVYYRVAGPRHASAAEIISGVGAFIAGGRWNPPGVMTVVYLSAEPETAMREGNEHFRYHNLPLWTGTPRVTVGVRVALEQVLDLTHATADLELPVPMNVLLAEDWRAIMARGEEATTQALARTAWLAGGCRAFVFPPSRTRAEST